MRSAPTDVEELVWWRLRGRKLGGLKFRRPSPIGRFIADFVCLEAKLIVELDRKQHGGSPDDVARTEALVDFGFKVIRFANERVCIYIDNVCEQILAEALCRLAPSSDPAQCAGSPSPTRGEG